MEDFLQMGGYGAYVWPAYAVSALGLGGLSFHVWRRGRTLARRVKAIEASRSQAPSVEASERPSP